MKINLKLRKIKITIVEKHQLGEGCTILFPNSRATITFCPPEMWTFVRPCSKHECIYCAWLLLYIPRGFWQQLVQERVKVDNSGRGSSFQRRPCVPLPAHYFSMCDFSHVLNGLSNFSLILCLASMTILDRHWLSFLHPVLYN